MKRPRILLIDAAISTISFFIIIAIYVNHINSIDKNDSAAVIGTGIGMMLMMPHLILFGLGLIFNWVGYGTRMRGFTLTAGILYCVSMLLGVTNFFILILPIILTFIGYEKQKQVRARRVVQQARAYRRPAHR